MNDPEIDDSEKFYTSNVPGGTIRHISETHWVAQCHVCPKRLGRRNFDSREDADQWFAEHLSPTSKHWRIRYVDPEVKAKRKAEEDFLNAIFKKPRKT